jgi:hypothetical protein
MSDHDIEPDDDLFTPEELEAMGAAQAIQQVSHSPEEKIEELNEQLFTMSSFISEGVNREAELRKCLLDLKEELRAAQVFQDVTFKFHALEKQVEAMGQATVEAKQSEEHVRKLLLDLREKLPAARVNKT